MNEVEIIQINEHFEIAHIPEDGYYTKLFNGDKSYQHGPFETLDQAERHIMSYSHRWLGVTWMG